LQRQRQMLFGRRRHGEEKTADSSRGQAMA
jgi:hypothetical protein